MFFYSYQFILMFLPVVLVGFFCIGRLSARLAAGWLAAASLVFYGYWNPWFVLLILASITCNYAFGYQLARRRGSPRAYALLAAAVVFNLSLLVYFKYTNFFISTANTLLHSNLPLAEITLPLGVSIFTFTQIAFVCDVYRGSAAEYNFVHYVLFVTYFPHLIAGPIIHHRQIMPQFDVAATYRPHADYLASGLVIFFIGLAKKVLLAASFAEYTDPVFDAVRDGTQPGLAVAWIGALAYALQIYFDFSGYSDMAIGLSRLFCIELPENFNSPYKARNIIEFWRRWNMTLSSFLRDYLYIPLGGNLKGPARRHLNLMLTMVLGGLWHGASWTFVAWGTLHGMYLVVNHSWNALKVYLPVTGSAISRPLRGAAAALTFLAVVIAWVFFRADSFPAAYRMLGALSGLSGETAAPFGRFWFPPDTTEYRVLLFAAGLAVVWCAPNTRELLTRMPLTDIRRRYVTIGAAGFWIFLLAAISASRNITQFIYFNF